MLHHNLTRRKFVRTVALSGAMTNSINSKAVSKPVHELFWGCLLHLSFNMWESFISPHRPFRGYRPDLELSERLWNDALDRMAECGVNTLVIDLGDAVKYKSHPEIAVNNAWSVERLKQELSRIRRMGMNPIPKLNFSATHDTWLGPYARMVSTKPYYAVCRDIIIEVAEIFDGPSLFHLGMDEETAEHQQYYKYVVVRQGEQWWNDLHFLIDEVVKNGSRPWVWSDYEWNHPDEFFTNMPKSVLQSNWYHGEKFDIKYEHVKAYLDLEKHGYDQVLRRAFIQIIRRVSKTQFNFVLNASLHNI